MNLADLRGDTARAYDSPAILLGRSATHDAYSRASVWIIVPALYSGFRPELLAALLVRRVTLLSGECPTCHAVADPTLQFAHGRDCAGSDVAAETIKAAYPPPPDPGRRLVDPDPLSRVIAGRRLVMVGGGRFELHL